MSGLETGATVEPVRHRQPKGAPTDMFGLQPPPHISTLTRLDPLRYRADEWRISAPCRLCPAKPGSVVSWRRFGGEIVRQSRSKPSLAVYPPSTGITAPVT